MKGVWDQGQSAAAPRIAHLAKRMATPFSSEQASIVLMRSGAQIALHELEMEFIGMVGEGRRSISIVQLTKRFRQLRDSLDALTPEDGK